MKRSILICLISALLFLTACSHAVPTLPEEYEADFSASGGELDCGGRITFSEGSLTVEMTSPDTVKGLTYTVADGELSTAYGELSCITDSAGVIPGSVPAVMYEVFTALDKAIYLRSTNEDDIYRLELSSGRAELSFRKGALRSFSTASCPYTFVLNPDD